MEEDPYNHVPGEKCFYFNLTNINVQSLNNKIDLLTHFLKEQNINLACITEHWLSGDVLDRVFIEDYIVATAYCRQSTRHGGAAIISKMTLLSI